MSGSCKIVREVPADVALAARKRVEGQTKLAVETGEMRSHPCLHTHTVCSFGLLRMPGYTPVHSSDFGRGRCRSDADLMFELKKGLVKPQGGGASTVGVEVSFVAERFLAERFVAERFVTERFQQYAHFRSRESHRLPLNAASLFERLLFDNTFCRWLV